MNINLGEIKPGDTLTKVTDLNLLYPDLARELQVETNVFAAASSQRAETDPTTDKQAAIVRKMDISTLLN